MLRYLSDFCVKQLRSSWLQSWPIIRSVDVINHTPVELFDQQTQRTLAKSIGITLNSRGLQHCNLLYAHESSQHLKAPRAVSILFYFIFFYFF